MFGLVNRLRMREDYIQIGLQITGDKNLKKNKNKNNEHFQKTFLKAKGKYSKCRFRSPCKIIIQPLQTMVVR